MLSFGANAVVLEPEAFRAEIAGEIVQMGKFYEQAAPAPAAKALADSRIGADQLTGVEERTRTQETRR